MAAGEVRPVIVARHPSHDDPGRVAARAGTVSTGPVTVVRVVTYNLRQLRDDQDALVAVIRDLAADVLVVQEPPRGPRERRRLTGLAAAAGLAVAVAGRGARTTALLVRPGLPTSGVRAIRLPWRPWNRRTLTRRGLAVLTVAGVQVVGVHLPLTPQERRRHLEPVLDLVDTAVVAGRPVVVAGDLNEPPGGPTWAALTRRLVDVGAAAGPTFPARDPRRRIDALLTAGLTLQGTHRPADDAARRASDHLPLGADLVIDVLP